MDKIGLWEISDNNLIRLNESNIEYEKMLEDWIVKDPNILMSGLTIIGRQINLENAGRLDLLAIDPQGTFIVIELKKGMLSRDVVSQSLDYISYLSSISDDDFKNIIDSYLQKENTTLEKVLEKRSSEDSLVSSQRQYSIIVVGTSVSEGLERIIKYLSENHQVPITSITFQIFETSDHKKYLSREIFETEYATIPTSKNRIPMTIDNVKNVAEDNGLITVFNKLIDIATTKGMNIRYWKKSLMFTSNTQKNNSIFTVWFEKKHNKIQVWGDNNLLFHYLNIDNNNKALFKNNGWNEYTLEEFELFLDNLSDLFHIKT